MNYKTKTIFVQALQLKREVELITGEKTGAKGNVGDWLVQDDNGNLFILTDAEFKMQYEAVGSPTTPWHNPQHPILPTTYKRGQEWPPTLPEVWCSQ